MNKRQIKIGAIGSLFTVICCFTPILVWFFSLIGLAAVVAYLDLCISSVAGTIHRFLIGGDG